MIGDALKHVGLARDIFISNMEYVLAHADGSLGPSSTLAPSTVQQRP
jgi:hypothetical protein